MHILGITHLFPSSRDPFFAPFNRQQLAALSKLCTLDLLATIPWFPGAAMFSRWSRAGRLARVPDRESIDGLAVRHPRFLYVPLVGYPLTAVLYAASLWPVVRRSRGIDAIFSAWAYPDGVAAVALGRMLRVPVVVKAHGSDLNVIGQRWGPRQSLRWALPRASRVVVVSRSLGSKAVALGAAPERIELVENGVDGKLFFPRDRGEARTILACDADARLILYVGRLERAKGVLDLVDAFVAIAAPHPELDLCLVGDGPDRAECERRAAVVSRQVKFLGALPLEQVPLWIAASNILTLPSWNEGTPNVLLEALACGRRIVATRVGGIPDLITGSELGELVPARASASLGAALLRQAYSSYDPAQVAARGARGDWSKSAERLHEVISSAVADHARGGGR